MTEQNEMNDVDVVDVELSDEQIEAKRPKIVAKRKGAKGPGKQVVIAKTLDDAEKIKADLEPTLEDGATVIFRDLPDTQIETYESWAEKQAKLAEEQAAKNAALSKLSADERAALGL